MPLISDYMNKDHRFHLRPGPLIIDRPFAWRRPSVP